MEQTAGKVAIVQIAAPGGDVLLVEVALDGQTLTISDKEHTVTDKIRELAQALIAEVREAYARND